MSNLNKIILILLISFSFCQNESNKTRDFLSAYFGVINGKDWRLNEDCFGGEYDKYLDDLYNSILKAKIFQVFRILDNIIQLELDKCPLDESHVIINDFKTAMRNATLLHNILKYNLLIKTRFDEFLASERSMKQLGLCLGEITTLLVYGTPLMDYAETFNSYKFLQ
jgi:hypothetical protein